MYTPPLVRADAILQSLSLPQPRLLLAPAPSQEANGTITQFRTGSKEPYSSSARDVSHHLAAPRSQQVRVQGPEDMRRASPSADTRPLLDPCQKRMEPS